MNLAKFRKMKSGGVNCLILPDGYKVDCDGCQHLIKADEAGFTSLSEVLAKGVCRTHWNRLTETFAIECGKELTSGQMAAIRGILHDVRAFSVVMNIAGVYSEKVNPEDPIRKIF